jgi:hypothetical protein
MSPELHDRLPDGAYLHRSESLELAFNVPDSETAWLRLTDSARQELAERVGGQIIDRFAGQSDQASDRVWAVALGPAGLYVASAGSDDRSWIFSGWRFQPGSLTTVTDTITEDYAGPEDSSGPEDSPGPSAADPQDAEEPVLAQALGADFRAFLGHLPVQVQVSVQRPFRRGPALTYFRWFLGDPALIDQPWSFWCYLTDGSTLVYAFGSRQPAQSPGAGLSWTVHRHQAAIA